MFMRYAKIFCIALLCCWWLCGAHDYIVFIKRYGVATMAAALVAHIGWRTINSVWNVRHDPSCRASPLQLNKGLPQEQQPRVQPRVPIPKISFESAVKRVQCNGTRVSLIDDYINDNVLDDSINLCLQKSDVKKNASYHDVLANFFVLHKNSVNDPLLAYHVVLLPWSVENCKQWLQAKWNSTQQDQQDKRNAELEDIMFPYDFETNSDGGVATRESFIP